MTGDSWGRLALGDARRTLEMDWRFAQLPQPDTKDSLLPRGRGRSYGDSCINSEGTHLGTRRLNRFIDFDANTGLLSCEAGLTLDEILQVIVPRGWFLPVVPGTRFVTLGGAIGNDVHGKNHQHMGSFGCHVRSLVLLRSNGERCECSEALNPDLFAATIGGLGLTGLVISAQLQLVPISSNLMEVEDHCFNSLEEFVALNEESAHWPYTVSWIDGFSRNGSVGRGVFSRARHASDGPLEPGPGGPRVAVPFTPPVSMVNRYTVDIFNRAYFRAAKRRPSSRTCHFQSFFFPLDSIGHWNRIYGGSGFYQYQCVVPNDQGYDALRQLLEIINNSAEASFLAVLKELGPIVSPGMLAFSRPGLTLALDFPNRGTKTLELLSSFDAIVQEVGGALYPAKDARMPAALFASGYQRLAEFRDWVDPAFSSSFWRRMQ